MVRLQKRWINNPQFNAAAYNPARDGQEVARIRRSPAVHSPVGSYRLIGLVCFRYHQPVLYRVSASVPTHGQHLESTQTQDSYSATLSTLGHLLVSEQTTSDCFSVRLRRAFHKQNRRGFCCHSKRRCRGGRCRGYFSRQVTLLLPCGPHPDEQRATIEGCFDPE
jgi:hypothetical protein